MATAPSDPPPADLTASDILSPQVWSKPGRRIYSGRKDIPWVLSGMGIAILSTPKGVMTGAKARKLGVGGEVLCKVW